MSTALPAWAFSAEAAGVDGACGGVKMGGRGPFPMLLAFVDLIPLWLLFLLTFVVVLGSAEIGHRFGSRRRQRSELEKVEPVGAMGATILGLLAFLLAFTFGAAADRYDKRKDIVLEEANAIGTCYLRTDFVSEPRRAELRTLLSEYVNVRVAGATGDVEAAMARSVVIQNQMWVLAASEGRQYSQSTSVALFIDSLNEVIDMHERRVMARNHIPTTIWLALYVVTVLAFGTSGYHAGLHASARSPVVVAITVAFSIVLVLISDLDRPMKGIISVDQKPMTDLQAPMGKAE
jgi:hypothetical protein